MRRSASRRDCASSTPLTDCFGVRDCSESRWTRSRRAPASPNERSISISTARTHGARPVLIDHPATSLGPRCVIAIHHRTSERKAGAKAHSLGVHRLGMRARASCLPVAENGRGESNVFETAIEPSPQLRFACATQSFR